MSRVTERTERAGRDWPLRESRKFCIRVPCKRVPLEQTERIYVNTEKLRKILLGGVYSGGYTKKRLYFLDFCYDYRQL